MNRATFTKPFALLFAFWFSVSPAFGTNASAARPSTISFSHEAMATVGLWATEPLHDASVTRWRRWSAQQIRVWQRAAPGAVILATAILWTTVSVDLKGYQNASSGVMNAVIPERLEIPKTFPAGNPLFVGPQGFSRAHEAMSQWPWLNDLYQKRIRQKAQSALAMTVPAVISNDVRSSETYGSIIDALATEFGVGGDPRYRNQAIRFLLAIRAGFHDTDAFVLGNDGLDFSVYIQDVLYTYSIVQSGLSPAQRDDFLQNMFRPAAMMLIKEPYGSRPMRANERPESYQAEQLRHQKSNHLTAVEAALVSLGLTIGGEDGARLVNYAVNNPHGGLLFQLRHSVLPGGLWWENSAGYHVYTLHFFQWAALALGNNGVALFNAVRPMAEAMLKIADPNGNMPYWGDSFGGKLASDYAPMLHLFQFLGHGGPFAPVLSKASAPTAERAQTRLEESLALSVNPPSGETTTTQASAIFPDAGVAVLRGGRMGPSPEGKLFAFLASPPVMDNAHGNAQNFLWFSIGGPVSSQPLAGHLNDGSRDYAKADVFGWRRGSASGIFVDDNAQKGWPPFTNPDTSGRLTYFDDATAEAITENAFPVPVRYERLVSLTLVGLFDVNRMVAQGPHDATLVVKVAPGTTIDPTGFPVGPGDRRSGKIYDALSQWRKAADTDHPLVTFWSGPASAEHVIISGSGGPQASVQVVQAPPAEGNVQPVMLITRKASEVGFVTAYLPASSNGEMLTAERLSTTSNQSYGLKISGATKQYLFGAILGDPAESKISSLDDPKTEMTLRGKTGFIEMDLSRRTIMVTGQVSEFNVPLSAGAAPTVTFNGSPLVVQFKNGRATGTTPIASGPISVKMLAKPTLRTPPEFGISPNPLLPPRAYRGTPALNKSA